MEGETEVLTSFEKGLGCDEERAREPRFLARLQRGDRITGQDRRRGAGVWVRLHRACLPHLVFFQNKGDTPKETIILWKVYYKCQSSYLYVCLPPCLYIMQVKIY